MSTGCFEEGQNYCEDGKMYQCQYSVTGFYASRASGLDSECAETDDLSPEDKIKDSDNDGVPDITDACSGSNDNDDMDNDGTPDDCDSDIDGDGYKNILEMAVGSDPFDAKSIPLQDEELVINAWETTYKLDSKDKSDASSDSDNDGLTNQQEYEYSTDPTSSDTDKDDLSDYVEVTNVGTDPTDLDTDDDGLMDGYEIRTSHTDPLDADSDDDGYNDGAEVNFGSDPNNAPVVMSRTSTVNAVESADVITEKVEDMKVLPGISADTARDLDIGTSSYVSTVSPTVTQVVVNTPLETQVVATSPAITATQVVVNTPLETKADSQTVVQVAVASQTKTAADLSTPKTQVAVAPTQTKSMFGSMMDKVSSWFTNCDGITPTEVNTGTPATFTIDAEGTSYKWDFGDGTSVVTTPGIEKVHTYGSVTSPVTITVIVTEDDGSTYTCTEDIVVT